MNKELNSSEINNEEAVKGIYNFILEEMKQNKSKKEITEKIIKTGVERSDAVKIVNTVYDEIKIAIEKEQFTSESIIPALVGGLIAAVVGGVVWGGIVNISGYEIGYMAWGIGLLCGLSVSFFTKGKKGNPLQIIAVLSSILGILIGKYFYFYHVLKEVVMEEYGVKILSIFSNEVIEFFMENIFSMVDFFDIIWVVLAIVTAWKMLRISGVKFD